MSGTSGGPNRRYFDIKYDRLYSTHYIWRICSNWHTGYVTSGIEDVTGALSNIPVIGPIADVVGNVVGAVGGILSWL